MKLSSPCPRQGVTNLKGKQCYKNGLKYQRNVSKIQIPALPLINYVTLHRSWSFLTSTMTIKILTLFILQGCCKNKNNMKSNLGIYKVAYKQIRKYRYKLTWNLCKCRLSYSFLLCCSPPSSTITRNNRFCWGSICETFYKRFQEHQFYEMLKANKRG